MGWSWYVCVCFLVLLARYMRPEGPWQLRLFYMAITCPKLLELFPGSLISFIPYPAEQRKGKYDIRKKTKEKTKGKTA